MSRPVSAAQGNGEFSSKMVKNIQGLKSPRPRQPNLKQFLLRQENSDHPSKGPSASLSGQIGCRCWRSQVLNCVASKFPSLERTSASTQAAISRFQTPFAARNLHPTSHATRLLSCSTCPSPLQLQQGNSTHPPCIRSPHALKQEVDQGQGGLLPASNRSHLLREPSWKAHRFHRALDASLMSAND